MKRNWWKRNKFLKLDRFEDKKKCWKLFFFRWLVLEVIFLSIFLIPELDLTVPAAGGDFGGLMRMPEHGDAALIVRLPLGHDSGRFPVPDEDVAVCVARENVTRRNPNRISYFKVKRLFSPKTNNTMEYLPHIRGKVRLASIARDLYEKHRIRTEKTKKKERSLCGKNLTKWPPNVFFRLNLYRLRHEKIMSLLSIDCMAHHFPKGT